MNGAEWYLGDGPPGTSGRRWENRRSTEPVHSLEPGGRNTLACCVLMSFALWLPPGCLTLPCCRTWTVCLTYEPASTSTKQGGQVHFMGPGSQQKA